MRPLLLALLAACSDPEEAAPAATDTDTDTGTAPAATCDEVESGVVSVTTRDGLALQADYLAPPACDAPGIVLVHMAPPNDRTNWPRSFRKALHEAGYAVISIDRRGAGGSQGNPQDAPGPNGRYDVEAAVAKLVADGVGEVAVLGASNGTTSMIDYAAWAPDEGLPEPFALGFMTGGSYTENQTPMSAVPGVPAVFTFSTAERFWSEAQRTLHPGVWEFLEYPNGDHGTGMFDAAPEVADDLVAFFEAAAG
jgi:pimeloyl-ACP methyl ester carboxylesterase